MANKRIDNDYIKLNVQTPLYKTIGDRFENTGNGSVQEITFSGYKDDDEGFSEACIEIEFFVPVMGIEYQWHPTCGFDHALKADWDKDICTMTSVSAPVFVYIDGAGKNKFTFALSELKKVVKINAGVHEEDGTLRIRIRISADDLPKDNEYRVQIYMSFEEIPYSYILNAVSGWWEKDCGAVPMEVPEEARYPMYSTWYSFHQQIDAESLEREAEKAKKLGFSAIIVDDGWQTNDGNRGYAYCGDWEPEKAKFPDMQKHVEHIHKLGMKFMIWFSVPFIGIHARHWDEFKYRIIYFHKEHQAGILDLRYPEIRKYLMDIYIRAVRDWKIDGLKLDFIDEFYFRGERPEKREGMDFTCIQEALDCFLTDVMNALKQINPSVMIEFRQRYIGPNIRKYGNIFRVSDCPNSGINNRVGIVDLRLLSGSTAVHSDMLMWNHQETAENAALQLINTLFATLQFSVRIDSLSKSHRKMLMYWLAFMREHLNVLQKSPIHAEDPQYLYPVVQSEDEHCVITVVYERNRVVECRNDQKEMILIRGTQAGVQVVCAEENVKFMLTVRDCCGEVKRREIVEPVSGYLGIFMEQADTAVMRMVN